MFCKCVIVYYLGGGGGGRRRGTRAEQNNDLHQYYVYIPISKPRSLIVYRTCQREILVLYFPALLNSRDASWSSCNNFALSLPTQPHRTPAPQKLWKIFGSILIYIYFLYSRTSVLLNVNGYKPISSSIFYIYIHHHIANCFQIVWDLDEYNTSITHIWYSTYSASGFILLSLPEIIYKFILHSWAEYIKAKVYIIIWIVEYDIECFLLQAKIFTLRWLTINILWLVYMDIHTIKCQFSSNGCLKPSSGHLTVLKLLAQYLLKYNCDNTHYEFWRFILKLILAKLT